MWSESMNKPLKLITAKEWSNRPNRGALNELINSKLKHGYASLDGDGSPGVMTPRQFLQTHEIFYITRPIEEEKPKCDHQLEYELDTPFPLGCDYKVHVAKIKKEQIKFCLKCGESLL